jgi:quinol-cytochrome oxidoreductase complex cytochrome b subunit
MSGHSTYEPKTAIERWLDSRLPIIRFSAELMDYPTPKNLNYWWTFGGILAFCLGVQIVTGIVLAMHYQAGGATAFLSVEQSIMRDVNHGWLLRGVHATGASMFFIAVYVHMFRGIYYGSYKAPREMLWLLGCVIYLLMMATAFMGYVLPWGQMSFWGAKVITNLLGAFPLIGKSITTWLWGGFAVDDPTLNRFFSLHYLLPFVIAAVVGLHIWALHVPGNNNPVGVNIKGASDTVPFHPYYTVKDGFAVSLFVILFAVFVFYLPDALGHVDNFIPANPLVTPPHIVPEWYFLPLYAILRAIPDKLTGVIAMFGAIFSLFILPWLDTSRVRSMRYRPQARIYFFFFILACIILGFCGANLPDHPVIGSELHPMWSPKVLDSNLNTYVWLSRIATAYFFAWFYLITPLLGLRETPLPVPDSISTPVLAHPAVVPAGAPAAPEKKG